MSLFEIVLFVFAAFALGLALGLALGMRTGADRVSAQLIDHAKTIRPVVNINVDTSLGEDDLDDDQDPSCSDDDDDEQALQRMWNAGDDPHPPSK